MSEHTEKNSRWTRFVKSRRLGDWVLVGLAVVVILASGIFAYLTKEMQRDFAIENQEINNMGTSQRVSRLVKQVNDLKAEMRDVYRLREPARQSIQINRISSSVKDIEGRLQRLETLIISDPAKALEYRLLIRDMNSLKEGQRSSAEALTAPIDRVYDLNKWLLGALAVSIVTFAVTNMFKNRE